MSRVKLSDTTHHSIRCDVTYWFRDILNPIVITVGLPQLRLLGQPKAKTQDSTTEIPHSDRCDRALKASVTPTYYKRKYPPHQPGQAQTKLKQETYPGKQIKVPPWREGQQTGHNSDNTTIWKRTWLKMRVVV